MLTLSSILEVLGTPGKAKLRAGLVSGNGYSFRGATAKRIMGMIRSGGGSVTGGIRFFTSPRHALCLGEASNLF